MFNRLVASIAELLPDFGKEQAIDGKSISSYGKKKGKREEDMRGEHDAVFNFVEVQLWFE